MADHISIKRPPPSGPAIYDSMPPSDECPDHCIRLNDADLKTLGVDLPGRGDLVHLSIMGRVIGVGDDYGERYVRLEITDVLFVENETTEDHPEKKE